MFDKRTDHRALFTFRFWLRFIRRSDIPAESEAEPRNEAAEEESTAPAAATAFAEVRGGADAEPSPFVLRPVPEDEPAPAEPPNADLPLPEGSTVLGSYAWRTDQGTGWLTLYEVNAGAGDLELFYRRLFAERNLRLAAYADERTVNLIGGDDQLSLLVVLTVCDTPGGPTSVSLSYGLKSPGSSPLLSIRPPFQA